MRRLSINKDGFELQLEREENGSFKSFDSAGDLAEDYSLRHEIGSRANLALSKGKELSSSLAPSDSSEKESVVGAYVTSPMVGSYYSSPSPEDLPFVKEGDKIEKGTVVCIIEAMKVMNEVKSSVAGVVAEVLVESGHPVEFGTKLFRII